MSLLCPGCRRYVGRERSWCTVCDLPLADGAPPLEIVLEDGTRAALTRTVTIGRAPGSEIRLSDPSVSRVHARILAPCAERGPVLSDAGSRFGTWLEEQRLEEPAVLRDGASIRVGDSRLRVERRREPAEAGRTIYGGAQRSGVAGARPRVKLPAGESRPRVRAGWALKRLEAAEAGHRWVLRDRDGCAALRLADVEADLFCLIDGRRSIAELIEEAERRHGAPGLAALTSLLAALAEDGLLAGGEGSQPPPQPHWRNHILTPRVFCVRSASARLERTYSAGGWLLFTRAGLAAIAAVAIAGIVALAVLAAGDDATPFVVTGELSLGALVFILGRLLVVVALHELAHGWTLVAFGRTPGRCGVKFVLGFPYAFVDTSHALFEPRRRRIAVAGAGPASDLTVGGAFALACLLSPLGVAHEILFQIALAAYVGALLNLNPLLERDGYHMLVDWLRIPNLRRRARERLGAGVGDGGGHAVAWYAAATLAWSVLTAGFVLFLSLRYADDLLALAPAGLVWTVVAACLALVLLPVIGALAAPILRRTRGPQEAA